MRIMKLPEFALPRRVFRAAISACLAVPLFTAAVSGLPFSQNAPQTAEELFTAAMVEYRQMEKPGEMPTHARLAEQQFKQLLTQFPESRFKAEAEQRLREAQEIVATYEFRQGRAYYLKGNPRLAIPRLESLVTNYPNFSASDEALWLIGQMYERGGPNFRGKAADAHKRIVSDYPRSRLADDARAKLRGWNIPVPEAKPTP